MKKFLAGMVTGWLVVGVALLAVALWAQQNAPGTVVQPQINAPGRVVPAQILEDNAKVKIERWKFEPGDRSPVHTHTLDHIYVVIHGSKIREYLADGTIHDDDQETGRVGFSPGRGKTHTFANIGDVPYEMVSIELKPAQ